jgi:CheY-like chemotaxis protein
LAEDGSKAVELVNIHQYSVVFMDVMMPGMDGLTATRKIIEMHGKNAPPIVAITANAFEEDKERCFNAGMIDFMAKPFKKREFIQILNKFSQHSSLDNKKKVS